MGFEQEEAYTDHKCVPVIRHPGGWALAFIHYSSDPDKDEEWAAKMKPRGLAEDWEKEMEINFSSVEGVRCFESFSLVGNTDDEIKYDPTLPLCLCCDFNVDPMAWVIAQVHPGELLHVIDEIWLSPGSIIRGCDEFLDKFSDHYGEVRLYGDASGRSRSQRDQRSNYDEIKLRFMRAPFNVRMKVPMKNPSNVNSVGAMNRRLMDNFGNPRLKINSKKCPMLIRDLVEVVWEDGNRKAIKKTSKRDNPYFFRTHSVDAAMSIVNREWPTRSEVARKSEEEEKHDRKMAYNKNKRKKRKLIGAFS